MGPEFWQRLLAAELAPQKSRALIEALGSSVGDPVAALLRSDLLTTKERERVQKADLAALERGLAAGIRPVAFDEYPEALAYVEQPPPALFVDGDFGCATRPTVAIIGTRNASTYGRACAHKFAEALARAGVTIISGGALGIDAAAHKGALEANGKTMAVLAGGVDHVYPAVHGPLFKRIRENGCLVSQFALGTTPREYEFLVRNTLIAMLSRAVLVVEAPPKSGALHTAVAATELGRDVFVVPGNIDLHTFRGSFNLIRDGATLVDNPLQILEALGIEPEPEEVVETEVSDLASQILAMLTVQPTPTEVIVTRTGLDASDVLAELTMLELDGRVIRDPGGYAKKP